MTKHNLPDGNYTFLANKYTIKNGTIVQHNLFGNTTLAINGLLTHCPMLPANKIEINGIARTYELEECTPYTG